MCPNALLGSMARTGWHREPARHALAAKGVRTATEQTIIGKPTTVTREAHLRHLLLLVEDTEKKMAAQPGNYPELKACGYDADSKGEYLNCDEVVDLVALPLLKQHGYSDAKPVVGSVEMADGSTQSHAWIELRGYIFDPTGDQLGTNTWNHPKLIKKTDPLAHKYLHAKERQVV